MVGPRGQTAAKLAAEKMEAPFPVLADPGRQAYRAYGFTKSLWVIQQSGWILLDKEGVVRYAVRSTNPQNSLDEAELLNVLEEQGAGSGERRSGVERRVVDLPPAVFGKRDRRSGGGDRRSGKDNRERS